MQRAHFRFYAELNDFLPLSKRGGGFTCAFEASASVKDVIEAFGVPHTEVALILVNGRSVDFSWHPRDGDRISIYPVFQSIDIAPLARVSSPPPHMRFILDTHLGRLAAYLRMLGFDSCYRNYFQDAELARISKHERRILLTRDRGLLKRSIVTHGYFVRSAHPQQQLVEVLRRFDLSGAIAPFRRCLHCNALLHTVPKDLVSHRLLPKTKQYYEQFHVCRECDAIYWKGSHYQRMRKLIEQVVGDSAG
jgi:uncharacterized protein